MQQLLSYLRNYSRFLSHVRHLELQCSVLHSENDTGISEEVLVKANHREKLSTTPQHQNLHFIPDERAWGGLKLQF